MRMSMTVGGGLFCAAVFAVAALAGDSPAAPVKVEPELVPDKELLAKIAALPENGAMVLPPFKVTGETKWFTENYATHGPKIRDYCNKMVWAPDRKRALYAGAGHNGPLSNDVWEYDLAANTWVCLYAWDWAFADLPKDIDKATEILRTRIKTRSTASSTVVTTLKGAPLRPAHTWWGLAYDAERRRMVFWDACRGLWTGSDTDKVTRVARVLGSTPAALVAGGAHAFVFDPAARKWDAWKDAPNAYMSSQLEYIPDRKALWLKSGNTYLCETGEAGNWKDLGAAGGPANGALSAYDPESKTIVAVLSKNTYAYSFSNNQWKVIQDGKSPDAVVPESTFCYDSVAKRFVLYSGRATPHLWLFDLARNEWTAPDDKGVIQSAIAGSAAGYFDEARGVTVLYSVNAAGQDKFSMAVYRAPKAGGGERK